VGPWESAIIAVAALVAVTVAVLAFRGLVESVEGLGNTCESCGRNSAWPLPVKRHQCFHCRHATYDAGRLMRRVVHH